MLNYKQLRFIVCVFLFFFVAGLIWILLPKSIIKNPVVNSAGQSTEKPYEKTTEVIASKADSTTGVEDKAFSDFVDRSVDELIVESKAKHNLTGIVYEAVPDSCWDNFFDKLETANSIKDFDLMLGESYDVSQSKQPACGIVVTLRSGEFT
ncbi:MAG TPA: hypothetical protein PLP05_12700, partial [Sedimentisphaerales bacterium]|nr:hypothetical protein [Sedimentisphaerales bacterium]